MSQTRMPTPRTRLVREAERGVYDRETAYRILDEGFLCHVGFVADGQPFVIPTSYGRKDDRLYIHGSAASRMYVPKSKWNDIRDRMVAMMKDIKMGDVRDFRNFMGAVIDKKSFDKISRHASSVNEP